MGTIAKIRTEFSGDGIAIIRMLNGQNRLNHSFLQEFNSALDNVLSNEKCKALITTSEGKFYSNGIDLEWLSQQSQETVNKFRKLMADTAWRIMHFPMPTVAAINGHAMAGGAFLAISHDYRVMRLDRGWFSWNEVRLKMQIGKPLLEIIQTKVFNIDAIREAAVFGRFLSAPEAKTLGLVDSAVSLDKIVPEAKRLAKQAFGGADIDRMALENMKKDIYIRRVDFSKL